MKLLLNIIGENTLVPFSHQHKLVGCLHKWLGQNEWHGQSSLFSFSRLTGGQPVKQLGGLLFTNGTTLIIGALHSEFLKSLLDGIRKDPSMFDGLRVREVVLMDDPNLSEREVFYPMSPILLKEHQSKGNYKHLLYSDEGANALLTQNLQKKLRAAGIEDPTAKAEFVVEGRPKSMLIDYRGVKNRASWCPVRIMGKPETKLLAWNVGLGNSTGIGFGAIK